MPNGAVMKDIRNQFDFSTSSSSLIATDLENELNNFIKSQLTTKQDSDLFDSILKNAKDATEALLVFLEQKLTLGGTPVRTHGRSKNTKVGLGRLVVAAKITKNGKEKNIGKAELRKRARRHFTLRYSSTFLRSWKETERITI